MRPFAALLGFAVLTACSKDAPKVADTSGAAEPAAEAAPASDAPTASSKVGQLPLLAELAPDGKCEVKTYPALSTVTRELLYEGDFPIRNINVGIGDSTRSFAPVNLEIVLRRVAGGDRQEGERLTVIFTASGGVQFGSRDYFTSDNSGSERVGLFAGDTAAATDMARKVMERCDRKS